MRCMACPRPAVQLHHVIYRQHLRSCLADPSDPRSVIPLCLRCHQRHHSRQAPIELSVLPDHVFRFAAEVLGSDRAYEYLHRRYAGSDLRLDALLLTATGRPT